MEPSASLYAALPTPTSIRVIQVHLPVEENQLFACSLHPTDLDNHPLGFQALSYTWGDPLYRYWFEKQTKRTWERDVPIICNGVQVEVTTNLHDALRAFSTRQSSYGEGETRVQYLWVDKLCINQDDIEERNTQVAMMARIYSKASRVVSWLGPADKDSEIALPLIQRLIKLDMLESRKQILRRVPYSDFMKECMSKADVEEIDSIPTEVYESLTRFLARQYFFRCWVLQEVMLARNISMLCGSEEVGFANLQKAALLVAWIKKHRSHDPIGQALTLPIRTSRHFQHEKAILELFQDREQLLHTSTEGGKTPPYTFGQLLALARISKCNNPKDKVYALLGIVPHGSFRIMPDYNKSIEQIYGEAIRNLINESKSLNCLSWVTDKSERRFPDFSTWIGEFEDDAHQQELAFASVTHNATLDSVTTVLATDEKHQHILQVHGAFIDRIAELAQPWHWHDGVRVMFDPRWNTIALQLPRTYPHTGQTRGEALVNTLFANEIGNLPFDCQHDIHHLKHVVRSLTCAAIVRCLHYVLYYPNGENEINERYEDQALPILCELDELFQGEHSGFIASWAEVRDTERRTCLCKATLSDFALGSAPLIRPSPNHQCPYICDFHLPKPTSHPYRSSISDRAARIGSAASESEIKRDWRDHEFGNSVNRTGRRRRLARTQKGYLAMVPSSSTTGDAVWLLRGASVPFVLRAVDQNSDTGEHATRWEVMGDSYVHGIMNGELWKDFEKNLVEIGLI